MTGKTRSEDLDTGAATRRVIAPAAVGWDELDPWMRPGGPWFAVGVTAGIASHLAPGHLPGGVVQSPALDDWAVTEPKIRPGSVTEPILADGSVTEPKVPTGALGARVLADGSLIPAKFAQGTRPVQIVDGLPDSPLDEGFLPGDAVVNVENDDVKIHRLSLSPSGWDRWDATDDTWDSSDDTWPSGVWTSAVDTGDLQGLLAEGNFGDDLIVARMVAADQIGATELAAIQMEVDKFIRSFNWDPGVAGWAIDGDGNAEFNDATFRGNIETSSVTAGQLVSSNYSAGSAGWALDANGNAELNDVTVRGAVAVGTGLVSDDYSPGSSGWALDGLGNAELNDATFRGNIEASSVAAGQLVSTNYSAGTTGWALDSDGTAEFENAIMRGTIDAATIQDTTVQSRLSWYSPSGPAGTGAFIEMTDLPELIIGSVTSIPTLIVDFSHVNIGDPSGYEGNMSVYGQLVPYDTIGHSWSTPSLFSGWSNFGGDLETVQYRRVGNLLFIKGVVSGSTVPSNIFRLPTSVRPSERSIHLCFPIGGSSSTRIDVHPDGYVEAVSGHANTSLSGIVVHL